MQRTKSRSNLSSLRGIASGHSRWHVNRKKYSRECPMCRRAGRDAIVNQPTLADLEQELNALTEVTASA